MTISLVKGQKISLAKDTECSLQNICIGINWGAIEKTEVVKRGGFFGIGGVPIEEVKKKSVDLDASCVMLTRDNNEYDTIYYGNLKSSCRSIKHSGDDLDGDMYGNDGRDNEVISVNLSKIPVEVEKVFFFLNSFRKQDFADIPYANIRIYEGTPKRVDKVLATYDIANDKNFARKISMIMGKLYKHNDEWKFHAIGEPTIDRNLDNTVATIINDYA
ncbi:MAG: TerD family protein [Hyphomicrobiales bacterium]